ncbi:hypothetical protein GCM10017783_21650 [Deinococcus piscis]|uniref:Uncharacterized protein n=1 Tax=Deinococcus piscis TaxID=394230 RepID=A0ABQ3KCM8_9DEIO|nr:hypothetical protein GCM10017783_21650 [Deinococcus piscis]
MSYKHEIPESHLKLLKEFTPHATPQQLATLTEAAQRQGRSLPFWDGVVYGLALSLHPDSEVMLQVLEIELELPEVREIVTEYAASIWARLNVDDQEQFDASVDPQLVSTPAMLREWLAGLAHAVALDPQPLEALYQPTTTKIIGERVISTMLIVMSFIKPIEDLDGELSGWQEMQEIQQEVMGTLEMNQATPEEIAETLQLLLLDVDFFYGYSAAIQQFGLDSQLFGNNLKFEPIQREGRKIRPNEPCPCGSGKKHKKCCGTPGAAPLL